MSPTWFDHALAAVLFVALPLEGARIMGKLNRAIAAGDRNARWREYLSTMAIQWGLIAVLLVVWFREGRALSALGFALPLWARTVAGLGLTALVLAFLVQQWGAIQKLDADGRARLRAQLGQAVPLLPRTDREVFGFKLLSITAGICEEVLYRGFLIWYLATWLGPWPAALVGAIGFGLAHWYQGRAGVLKTGLIGAIMGAFYLATGSLLWPAIVHAAIDLQGGAAGRFVLAHEEDPR